MTRLDNTAATTLARRLLADPRVVAVKEALTLICHFVRKVADEIDLDTAETLLSVKVMPSGRAVTTVSLEDVFQRCDAALRAFGEDRAERQMEGGEG